MTNIDKHYLDRYLFEDWSELCERVSNAIASNNVEAQVYYNIMYSKTFMPAGNTLVAGLKPIAPNCSVLGLLTDDNFAEQLAVSRELWSQGTGIGYNLSGLTDPVGKLQTLSDVNDSIDLKHRPKRGNMAVLSATHPEILSFINCKNSGSAIYNFNISVTDIDQASPEIFDAIAEHAHATGDPGLVFLERGRCYGPIDASEELGEITTCVPCGEQFMHAYETCNLGSINLNSEALMTPHYQLDFHKLEEAVRTAIDMLDTVVDKLVFPTERLRETSLAARRIGLGVTGWADYLERCGIAYDSEPACGLATYLSFCITQTAWRRSRELARLRGPCKLSSEYRNISVTCIAPTGGITGLLGLRGYGIEPFFSDAVSMDYRAHINMQAAWQSGIQNAISKTVNLPASATVDDVKRAYNYARKRGCKGITIYRDRSKEEQPRSLSCDACETV